MERKTFSFKLLDGKEYKFAERNREDIDFGYFQNRLRSERFKFIQENVIDETDRLALLRLEVDKIYSDQEIGIFILSNLQEQLKLVYASFKVMQPEIPFDEFSKLVNQNLVNELTKLISDLEKPEEIFDDVITKELGITQSKLASWNKEQPALYKWLKKAGNIQLKKKEVKG